MKTPIESDFRREGQRMPASVADAPLTVARRDVARLRGAYDSISGLTRGAPVNLEVALPVRRSARARSLRHFLRPLAMPGPPAFGAPSQSGP